MSDVRQTRTFTVDLRKIERTGTAGVLAILCFAKTLSESLGDLPAR